MCVLQCFSEELQEEASLAEEVEYLPSDSFDDGTSIDVTKLGPKNIDDCQLSTTTLNNSKVKVCFKIILKGAINNL